MKIAFRTGGVAGMFTVGLGLFGAALVVLIYKGDAPKVLEGFGFGAALLAMFMRVGGGIFTKAADVGADLVGKVEQGIPEDDPRNAATIADNVGDNVGDCAGMAADLFESYAVTLVAALILGKAAFGDLGLVFPLRRSGHRRRHRGHRHLRRLAARQRPLRHERHQPRLLHLRGRSRPCWSAIAAFVFLPDTLIKIKGIDLEQPRPGSTSRLFNPRSSPSAAVLIGIILAAAIQQLTAYFTETNRRPVDDVAKTSLTGPATVILSGISLGLESAVYSALLIGAAVYAALLLGGGSVLLSLFAIALAGTGLLTTVGVIVSMDTFGPVSDNAQGIAEMSGDVERRGRQDPHQPRRGRQLDQGDHQGHRDRDRRAGGDRAVRRVPRHGRSARRRRHRRRRQRLVAGRQRPCAVHGVLNVANPRNLVGLLIGASVVFLFSGLAINAVSRAAGAVIFEVRRQFRDDPGIMEGTEQAGVRQGRGHRHARLAA